MWRHTITLFDFALKSQLGKIFTTAFQLCYNESLITRKDLKRLQCNLKNVFNL
jgi:hypothetical protein